MNEGLPLSLIEGLRFGKPLITNKLSAVLDVNKPGETGFAYDDFSSLIDGLNHLPHIDWAIYKQMASNARKRFEECFTEEKMINRYKLMLYNEIKCSPVTM